MAQTISVQMIDDLDGGDAEETVTFSLDGADYEIDLNDEHADALRATLEPFVQVARRTGGRLRRGRGTSRTAKPSAEESPASAAPFSGNGTERAAGRAGRAGAGRPGRAGAGRTVSLPDSAQGRTQMDREQSAAIRVWGRSNGYPVRDRGRLPEDLIVAFEQAHNVRVQRAKQ